MKILLGQKVLCVQNIRWSKKSWVPNFFVSKTKFDQKICHKNHSALTIPSTSFCQKSDRNFSGFWDRTNLWRTNVAWTKMSLCHLSLNVSSEWIMVCQKGVMNYVRYAVLVWHYTLHWLKHKYSNSPGPSWKLRPSWARKLGPG